MTNRTDALSVARAYHDAWTDGDVEQAGRYLVESLQTDVPLNSYATKDEFLEAVRGFSQMGRPGRNCAASGATVSRAGAYDELWAAIADPTRRRVLDVIVARGRRPRPRPRASSPVTTSPEARSGRR